MADNTSIVEIEIDTGDVIDSISKASETVDELKRTVTDVGGSISKAFTMMLNSLKQIHSEIKGVNASVSSLSSSLNEITTVTEAPKDNGNLFSSIQEGYDALIGFIDKVKEVEKNNAKIYDFFPDAMTAPNGWFETILPKTTEMVKLAGDCINPFLDGIRSVLTSGSEMIGGSVTGLFEPIKSAFSGISSVFSGMSLGWGAAIAGIVTLIVLLVTNWDTVKAAILSAWEAIKGALATAAEWIDTTVIQPIVSFFAPIVEWFTQLLQSIWKVITDVVGGIVSFIIEYNEMVKTIWSAIGTWLYENVIQPIINFFTPLVEWFGQLFQSIWQTVTDIFSNIVAFIAGYVETVMAIWGAIGEWFYTNVIQPVAGFFAGLWTSISTWAINAWNNIVAVFTGVSVWFYLNVIMPVNEFFAGLWGGFTNAANQAWESVKAIFSKVANFFKDIFSRAWANVVGVFSSAGAIFTNIKDGILTAFKSIVNGIITGINNVVAVPFNGINFAIEKIKNINILGLTPFGGLKTISVPQIPYLAQGAVLPANRPFLAVVGDQKHGTNVEAPLATIQEAVALVMDDHIAAMMSGFQALLEEERATRQTIEGIQIGDTVIGEAAARYNRRMNVIYGR